jgi:hypothetical protein
MKRPWTLWLLVASNVLLAGFCGIFFVVTLKTVSSLEALHLGGTDTSFLTMRISAAIQALVGLLSLVCAWALLKQWRWGWWASLLINTAYVGMLVGLMTSGRGWSGWPITAWLVCMVAVHFASGVKSASNPDRIEGKGSESIREERHASV